MAKEPKQARHAADPAESAAARLVAQQKAAHAAKLAADDAERQDREGDK